MHKSPRGRFQRPYLGGGGAGTYRNLLALLGPLPPITKFIRNQETTVRYIICASGA
jgi:hypothetical protein